MTPYMLLLGLFMLCFPSVVVVPDCRQAVQLRTKKALIIPGRVLRSRKLCRVLFWKNGGRCIMTFSWDRLPMVT